MPGLKGIPPIRPIKADVGCWWKFDRYEIKDGWLRPAKGSRFECYQPWDQYEETQNDNRPNGSYLPLLKLLRDLGVKHTKTNWLAAHWLQDSNGERRFEPRSGIGISPIVDRKGFGEFGDDDNSERRLTQLKMLPPGAEELLCKWASCHGLLGILPHIAESVTLSSRWAHIPAIGSGPEGERPRQPPEGASTRLRLERQRAFNRWRNSFENPVAESVTYYRQNGRWLQPPSTAHDVETNLCPVRSELGKPLAQEFSAWIVPARTQLRYIDKFGIGAQLFEDETLLESWTGFFPDVDSEEAETYAYPRPLTEQFWKEYAEPVDEFIRYALIFQQAVEPFMDGSELAGVVPINWARGFWESLVAPVGISIAVEKGQKKQMERKPRESWIFPSLLSAYARMALQDLSGGGRILYCANEKCRKPFTSKLKKTKYCSEKCGWAVRVRRRRAR